MADQTGGHFTYLLSRPRRTDLGTILLQKFAAQSDKMLLNIDLPKFDFPVIFDEHVSKPCAFVLYLLNKDYL